MTAAISLWRGPLLLRPPLKFSNVSIPNFSPLTAVNPIPQRRIAPAKRPLATVTPPPPPPPAQARSRWPQYFRSALYAIIFGMLGYHSLDYIVNEVVGPVIEPDTPEAEELLRQIRQRFGELEIVQELRANPEFVEWEAYGHMSPEERKQHSLGGVRTIKGFSSQHIFWNAKEKTAITVLYMGNGINGWPTVVHGGALAILLDESMGRIALLSFPQRTGVTANLNIDYRKPFRSRQFCTVVAKYDQDKSTSRKAVVTAELRDQTGQICAEASALFVVPRTLALKKLGERF